MVIRSDYTAGTVTVSAGGTVVTGVGTGWFAAEFQEGDVFIADGWYCVIASVDSNTQITLHEDGGMRGGALAGAEYRLRYMSNGSRVSAQARELIDMLGASGNLQALGGLNGSNGDVPYFTGPGTLGVLTKADITMGVRYDAMVDTLPDRDVYDGQPVGFTVLVSDTGDGRAAIYVREGGAGNWSAPAYITGPSLTLDVDQVNSLPYGDDPTVTLNSIAGGYELNFGIPQGMEIVPGTVATLSPGSPATVDFIPVTGGYQLNFGLPKGDTGTLTGLTPFYQTQVTTASDAAAARTGLGATTLGSALFTATDAAAARTSLGVGTVGTINLPAVANGDILYDDGTWGTPPEGGGYDPNIALLALEVADLKGGRMGMVGGVADPFDDETGVATKTNAVYSAANDWYTPATALGSTLLLLHLDGTNGSTSIVDNSGYNRTATAGSGFQISTAQSKFGGASGRFDGTNNGAINFANNGDFSFGTGDFTAEFWIRFASFSAFNVPFGISSNANGFELILASSTEARIYIGGTSSFARSFAYATNTWYHVAIVRSAGMLSLFIDGNRLGAAASHTQNLTGTGPVYIGARPIGGDPTDRYPSNCWIDEVKVSNVAVYSSNFTPPVAPYPNTLPGNMTLTSVVYPSISEPSIGRLTVQTSETVAITPNDDLIGEISRDGGTTWSEANLTLASSLSGIKLYEDSNIDLSAQPSGDDMVWRVRTDNNVDVAVSGVVAQWKE